MTLKAILTSISRKEWQFVAGLTVLVIIITSLPLLYGWLTTPPDHEFTGIHFAAPNDWFVYYSYLEQTQQGNWLFTDLFTAKPNQPVLNIFWLAIGWLGVLLPFSKVVIFNLARLVLIPVFYLVIYVVIAYFFQLVKQRRLALVVVSFSSGLGLLLLNRLVIFPHNFANGQFNWPLDLWVPEAYTFFTLYYSPHFIASLTLIIASIFLAGLAATTGRFRYSLAAGSAALVLFSFHPFHVISVLGVIGAYYIVLMIHQRRWSWRLAGFYALIVGLSLPAIGYYGYLLQTDWVIQQKALQNQTLTTPLWITLFSYGLLLFLAVAGAIHLIRRRTINPATLLLLVWAGVHFVALYAPVNYQRRMTAGLQIPLAFLATIALSTIGTWVQQHRTVLSQLAFRWRYVLVVGAGMALFASTIFQLSADIVVYSEQRTLAYIDNQTIAAARWLKSTESDSIIFNSAQRVVNIIPAYAGRAVYVGHGVETPAFGMRQQEVNWFFDHNRDEDIERTFLEKRGIDYIFYSDVERELGSYSPDHKAYLQAVYYNDRVQIYKVL